MNENNLSKDTNKDSSEVAKAAVWYSVSNILLKGVSIITVPIFTRLLTTSDYGISSNYTSWVNIIGCVTGLGLSTAVMRGKIEYDREYASFLSSIQFLSMFFTGICSLVMITTIDFWTDFLKLDKICIMIMLAYLIFSQSFENAQMNYRFEYKYKTCIGISVLNAVLIIGISVVSIIILPSRKYLGRILGQSVPYILFGSIFAAKFFVRGRCFVNLSYWKYALKLSLPMIPHGLAMIVLAQIDRVMIIRYCGESEAGIYSFGYSYAILLSIVTNAINFAVQPEILEMLKNGKDHEVVKLTYRLMLIGVMLTIFVVGVGPEVMKILGTSEYYDAVWIIFPVAVGTLFQFFYQFFGLVEIYSNKTYYTAIGSCGAAIVNYLLNDLLIPRYGFIAGAYTTFVSYGALMIFHYIAARVSYGKKIYSLLYIGILSVVLIVCCGFLNMLYGGYIFRYLLLVVILTGMYFYLRKDIKRLAGYIAKR